MQDEDTSTLLNIFRTFSSEFLELTKETENTNNGNIIINTTDEDRELIINLQKSFTSNVDKITLEDVLKEDEED